MATAGGDELARLLEGLRSLGLAIGIDDAARIAAVFRHADGWSRPQRIRALRALVGRTAEERRRLDEVEELLFVDARPGTGTGAECETATDRSGTPRRRWWRRHAVRVGAGLAVLIAIGATLRRVFPSDTPETSDASDESDVSDMSDASGPVEPPLPTPPAATPGPGVPPEPAVAAPGPEHWLAPALRLASLVLAAGAVAALAGAAAAGRRRRRRDRAVQALVGAGGARVAYEYAYARRLLLRRADGQRIAPAIEATLHDAIDLGASGELTIEDATTLSFAAADGHPAAFAYKAGRLERKAGRWELYPEEILESRGGLAPGDGDPVGGFDLLPPAIKTPYLPTHGVVLMAAESDDA